MRPNFFSAASASAAAVLSSPTSPGTAIASPPASRFADNAVGLGLVRPHIHHEAAPASASANAITRPIFRPAPVTMATFPAILCPQP